MAGHDVVALWQRAAFDHRQRLLTLLHIAGNTSTPEPLGKDSGGNNFVPNIPAHPDEQVHAAWLDKRCAV